MFFNAAMSGRPITIHGDGAQTRDFVHVADIAGALAFVAENEEACGVFNVGYGRSLSIIDLAKQILEITNSRSPLEFAPARTGDIRHSTADPSKLHALGWMPIHGVRSGLETMAHLT